MAVVGGFADKLVLGDYTGTPTKTVAPIEGITEELAKNGVNTEHVGAVSNSTNLYNIKSVKFVMNNGSEKNIDLSKTENVSGMELIDGGYINVTPKAVGVIKNIDFQNVKSVRVEMAERGMWGGSLNISYGQGGPTVAVINSQDTDDENTYKVCEGDYTGTDGGYNGTEDMYISASAEDLSNIISTVSKKMSAIELDGLENAYNIFSVNEKILVDGVIDYRIGGLQPYNGADGTITNSNPAYVNLAVTDDNGNVIEGVIWQIKNLDASSRLTADIDSATGKLTVYGNGTVQITAADLKRMKCARQTVYINTQIEGEYADDGNGANLSDAQKGTSGNYDVGSSSKYWIEYKSVKLNALANINFKYSKKRKFGIKCKSCTKPLLSKQKNRHIHMRM